MLQEGNIIKGPFWNEHVKVEKIEEIGSYIRIVGYTLDSKNSVNQLINKQELDKLEQIDSQIDFSSDPENTFFLIEATRFKYASLFDPLLAMNVSKVDPLPFQIEAVYGYVLKQPRIRFLIADDPGAGKTIMSGLIIKELKLRRLARRILIVVPGHLKDQWRRELKEKFTETFVVLDRYTFNAHYGENPWERNDQIITSLDFIKQEEILFSLNSVSWDLVIVDEAHKMSAYSYANKITKTTVVILDNASIHTSKLFKAQIEKWKKLGLQLLFLPPYSPELNKIEILWKHMKYHYHKLEAYLSFDNLHKHVKNLLDGFGTNYDINFK